jgi:hypothetical protein
MAKRGLERNAIAGAIVLLALGTWSGAHGCSGGGGSQATPGDAIAESDVMLATCTADWCATVLGPYCDRILRECAGRAAEYDGPNHDALKQACIDSAAKALSQSC